MPRVHTYFVLPLLLAPRALALGVESDASSVSGRLLRQAIDDLSLVQTGASLEPKGASTGDACDGSALMISQPPVSAERVHDPVGREPETAGGAAAAPPTPAEQEADNVPVKDVRETAEGEQAPSWWEKSPQVTLSMFLVLLVCGLLLLAGGRICYELMTHSPVTAEQEWPHLLAPPESRTSRAPSKKAYRLSMRESGAHMPINWDRVLNSDLVVPAGSECVLMIAACSPEQPAAICDQDGGTMMMAVPKTSLDLQAKAFDLPWIALTTAAGDTLAKFAAVRHGPNVKIVIHKASGEFFGRVVPAFQSIGSKDSPDHFVLEMVCGHTLHIFGDKSAHRMSVADSTGAILASMEPQSPDTYKLRVMPLMDVGLVVCCILGTQHF